MRLHEFFESEDSPKGEKRWYNDYDQWKEARLDLPTTDDDQYTSRYEGQMIAKWYDDRDEGWIRDPKERVEEGRREAASRKKCLAALAEHVKRGVPLWDSVFRYQSPAYMETIRLARKLREAGYLQELDWESEEILGTDIGREAIFERRKVFLDCPYMHEEVNEAEYQGRDVDLGKPKRGGSKKFYVYVRDPKTKNVRKVEFGASGGGGDLSVKLQDPEARKNFASRHNCEKKTDKTKPGYWSCRLPRYAKQLGLKGSGRWW